MTKLQKIKRPGGVFTYEGRHLTEDEFGVWIYFPAGARWQSPQNSGTMPFECLILLKPEQPWVACWANDPRDRRLEIDVCLPPQRNPDGWSYIDLELDPVRHESGFIEVEDHDEFEAACRDGWITQDNAHNALKIAITLEAALRDREEPLGELGWRRLAGVTPR